MTTGAQTQTRMLPRPDISLRPSCETPDKWLVSWGEGSQRTTMEVTDDVAAVLATLPDKVSPESLAEMFRESFSEADAERLARHFAVAGMFVTDGDAGLTPGEQRWLAMNWNDALALHRSTRGIMWRHEYPADAQVMVWTDADKPMPVARLRPRQRFDDLADSITLTPPREEWLADPVGDTFRRRRTKRGFKDSTLTEPEVSTLLHAVFRPIIKGVSRDYYTTLSSADGYREKQNLHPLTVYVIFGRRQVIEGQDGSVYRYNPETHSLQETKSGALPGYFKFSSLLWGQDFADDAPMSVVMCLNWEQFMWKYPTSHAYRFAHYDIGGYMQAAQLVSTAIGLNAFITPAMDDVKVSRLLGTDEGVCAPTYFLALGRTRGNAPAEPAPDVSHL